MPDAAASPPPAAVVPRATGPSAARATAKATVHGLATVVMLPWLLCYWLGAALMGKDRALEGLTQAIAPFPGLTGVYLRRAFLCRVLARCDRTAEVCYGGRISGPRRRPTSPAPRSPP